MAKLTDLFEDYLVTYKVPDKKQESVKKDPYLTSDRFKQYLSTKSKSTTEETPEQIIAGFTNWTYNTDSESTNDSEDIETPTMTQSEWIDTMTNAYKKAGLSDNAIKNLIAKNALESSWGKSTHGRYNYGNITVGSTWKGDFVEGQDKDKDGNTIIQKFRSYKSLDEYVQDELKLLRNIYDFNQDDNIDDFLDKLQGNNPSQYYYAESPDYKSSVKFTYYNNI